MLSDTKTRKSMKDVEAGRMISGDGSSANQVDPDQMFLNNFGDDFTGLPALPCSRNDALVGNGAAAQKSCLSTTEMRTRTAAGGLLPAGTASTTMTTIFPRPRLPLSLVREARKRTCRTFIQYASYYRSVWKSKVLETKSRQTLVFDPGGSTGHLRACPILGTWRTLLCGEVFVWAPTGGDLKCFWQIHDPEHHLPKERAGDPYVLRLNAFPSRSQART